jgi:hypothetical protein
LTKPVKVAYRNIIKISNINDLGFFASLKVEKLSGFALSAQAEREAE